MKNSYKFIILVEKYSVQSELNLNLELFKEYFFKDIANIEELHKKYGHKSPPLNLTGNILISNIDLEKKFFAEVFVTVESNNELNYLEHYHICWAMYYAFIKLNENKILGQDYLIHKVAPFIKL